MFRSPITLLAVLLAVSVTARVALLEEPCRSPCRSASDHVLVFDEDYYVNAARVIAGVHLAPNARYATAPAGTDPNAEHPQLAKLVIAASIELFGDGPLAWRLGSIVFGSLAILGLYVLVRAAGGSPWVGLGACALIASDNLLLVHARIGTLDIYALAAMIWGTAMYLRGRPLVAGAIIGVGACFKLVTPYVLLVLLLIEATRTVIARGDRERAPRWRSLFVCAAGAVVVFIALLAILDRVARPYDATTGRLVTGGPFSHLAHMLSYAASQSSPQGPHGIASYPWQWLGDYKPIVYLNINPARPAPGLYGIHPAAHFLGMISPPVMLLAIPALILAAVRFRTGSLRELDVLGLAWFAGTWIPFELLSLIWNRTSYLYYMVIVMPGIYIAVIQLIARGRSRPRLVGLWWVTVALAAILMYPFTPLP
jgi:predicted membrane-bound dolichyl-phosphate-mannose-protein mannosyltransferase